MEPNHSDNLPAQTTLSDEQIVDLVRKGAVGRFETLMRRYNRKLYRIAYSIVRNSDEAEDVVQETYYRAYLKLNQFTGTGRFASWLTRIAVHEALGRKQKRGRFIFESWEMDSAPLPASPLLANMARSPEQRVSDKQLGKLIRMAIERLPSHFRSVFILRALEQLSTNETARSLALAPETVKTRFHRAKRLLRNELKEYLEDLSAHPLTCKDEHCAPIIATVLLQCENKMDMHYTVAPSS